MTAVLDTILRDVRVRLAERRKSVPLERLRAQANAARKPLDVITALRNARPPAIIAEVKRKSPSQGNIAPDADPSVVARDYVAAGATMLSVLTERDHFGGAPEVLQGIRVHLPAMPLLMKDFVVDPSQLYEARLWGADCVLVMVVVLGEETGRYLELARELGLTALVEVHDSDEMRIARDAGATLVGVNNRDLKTMRVDLATGVSLAREAPKDALLVAESGIATGDDIRRLAGAGYRGFLVGTSLMKSGEPGAALQRLYDEARS